MIDIKKPLTPKKNFNLKKNLFQKYQNFIWLFEFKKANGLFSFKKPTINHFIKLEKINDKNLQILWKSLYNMFQNELLILRKILNDYLNKKFIKINNSLIVSFVLFVQKFDEKLLFCVNYHALNKFTRKNHYLLSLIHKTLNNISKTKWFMKLDIIIVLSQISYNWKGQRRGVPVRGAGYEPINLINWWSRIISYTT